MRAAQPSLSDRKIASLRVTGPHRLCLRFRDGLIAEIDLGDHFAAQKGPAILPIRDPEYFAQVYLDHGVLSWPNGYDLDPDTVRSWATECDPVAK